ncbi:MAG: hypothetical protein ABSC35_01040 [Candidatus Dormibacteria bacterium]
MPIVTFSPSSLTHRLLVTAVLGSLATAACGPAVVAHPGTTAADLRTYLATVEPIRLGVNALLEGADPIIDGFREHTLTDAQAAAKMGALEATFADYTVDMAAIQPPDPSLAAINAPYAHTFILEDSYLNALVNGMSEDDVDDLPDTQSDQRAAIIEWRVQLEVLGRKLGVALPADLQQAGRGEIAPSVSGDS